jgi:hypothetical protein
LFGAGFYGANDAIHMLYEGMLDVTVVDSDKEKMHEMAGIYPGAWYWHIADLTTWLPNMVQHKYQSKWDVISVDAPMGMFPWVLSNFDTIALLANKYLVITMSTQLSLIEQFPKNKDWTVTAVINRSLSALTELIVLERVAAPGVANWPSEGHI